MCVLYVWLCVLCVCIVVLCMWVWLCLCVHNHALFFYCFRNDSNTSHLNETQISNICLNYFKRALALGHSAFKNTLGTGDWSDDIKTLTHWHQANSSA